MTEEQRTALNECIAVASQLPAMRPTVEVALQFMQQNRKSPPDLFDLEEARRMLEQQHDRIKALEEWRDNMTNAKAAKPQFDPECFMRHAQSKLNT